MPSDLKILSSENGEYYGDFNDLVIVNGDMLLTTGADKIAQDVVKILSIDIGSNYLFPNYGTTIAQLICQRNTPNIMKGLRDQIIYALTYVSQINKNESINIKSIQSVDIQIQANYYVVTMLVKLTDNSLLTINKNFALTRN